MGSISIEVKNNGTKRFRAKVRKEGQTFTKRFMRKTDATNWMKDIESKIYHGQNIPKLKKYFLGEAVARYIREILPLKRAGTRRLQIKQLEFFRDQLGKYPLNKITTEELSNCRELLLTQDVTIPYTQKVFKRTPSTVNRYFQVLNHLFTVAKLNWGWVAEIPKLKKLSEPFCRTEFFSPEQTVRIYEELRNNRNSDVRLIAHISMLTGSRLGETCALIKQDIDYANLAICFRETKTGRARWIPITEKLAKELFNWSLNIKDGDFLFPASLESKKGYVYDKVRKEFKKSLLKLGIKKGSFHTLRHTVGSRAAHQGINLKLISDTLGHSRTATTDRYMHTHVEHLRAVVEVMEEGLGNGGR